MQERENTRQSVRDQASCHFVHYLCSLEELNMGNMTHTPFIRLRVSLGLSKKQFMTVLGTEKLSLKML